MRSKKMQEFLEKVFPEETKAVSEGRCPSCKELVDRTSFRDNLSVQEYHISGLCQQCQDKVFEA